MILNPRELLREITIEFKWNNSVIVSLPNMDRTFIIWKRIFDIRWSKVPASETNYQVSIQTFKLSLLSYLLLDKDITVSKYKLW